MKKIAIVGAGGFGREVKMLIDQINIIDNKYEVVGFYDDLLPIGEIINGLPILGKISDLNKITEKLYIGLALGNPSHKKNVVNQIKNSKIIYESLIHPSVIIGKDDVIIGKGVIICAGNIITCNIKINDFVIINLACTVGHDTIIKNFVSIMPGVNISGEVLLEENVYIGTGAKIINQVQIGKDTIVGSGAVVSKSLPENCTAVGIPAKIIKYNVEND